MPHAIASSATTFTALRRVSRLLLAASAAALVTTACGGGGDDYPALQRVDTAKMQVTVATLPAEMLVPGVGVLVRTPKGDFKSYHGTTMYKGSTPTGPNQRMRVGSVTKTWTGTVILHQVQEGLLKLADPIAKYVAGVPKGDEITIEQLLMMRSGLFNYTITVEFNQALVDNPQRVRARAKRSRWPSCTTRNSIAALVNCSD